MVKVAKKRDRLRTHLKLCILERERASLGKAVEKRWAEGSSNSARRTGDWRLSKQSETGSDREQQEKAAKF